MVKALNVVTLSFFIVVLLHYTLAKQQEYGEHSQQQQQNVCQIQNLQALEPRHRINAEAGYTEYWDYNNQQLQCAGVAACRTVIQPRGLLLPQYTNAPSLFYVVQGRGMTGVLMSGCPETFQSSQQQGSQEREGQEERQRFWDQHQKVRRYQQGDIIALPAGVAHWCYNDGEEDLVLVAMEHTSNRQNQLDSFPRKFLLAGNPQERQEQHGQQEQQRQQHMGNIFRGFTTDILTKVFGVDEQTARRLQGREDERGHIIRVEGGLQVITPPRSRREEEERVERANGLEETVCNSRLVHDINNPSRADYFSPRAGRINSVNSFNLPILKYLQLSAEHGVLYKNAIKAPHWTQNAHKIVYVARGEAQMQIVDQRGEAVFNERIREGQLIVVPQNFVLLTQATNQGFEWISFKTNDNAIFQTLSGRTSAIRAMPVDVIANAYKLSREQAQRVKTNREEVILFEPSQRSPRAFA